MHDHGGVTDALRARGVVCDFSANVNPYGPHAAVAAAVRAADPSSYPDPTATPARRAIAASLGCEPDEIVVGPGVASLLWTLARVALSPGATALVVEPTFSELRRAAAACGARVCAWRARADDGFTIDLHAVDAAIGRAAPRLVYVCAPNNPTGVAVPAAALAELARAHPRALFAVDQSFLSLSDRHADDAVVLPANAVALRSLTKSHALAGVRVGYARCAPAIARAMERQRPPWSTSAAAIAAAVAASAAGDYVASTRDRMLADLGALRARLAELDLPTSPSSTVFTLARVPDAARLHARLLDRGVLVRDCSSFGLPRHIRLAARPRADVDLLVRALS